MNSTPTELIICGGGYSIKEGLSLGLKDKMKNKFVISLNKSIEAFPNSTILSFVDCKSFYSKYKNELTNYPLIIGKHSPESVKEKLKNTVLFNTVETYDRTLKTGIYSGYLAGLFALSLGIYLLNEGNIYLLGFDGGQLPAKETSLTLPFLSNGKLQNLPVEDVTNKFKNEKEAPNLILQDGRLYRIISHFYQGDIEHRGIGKTEFYVKNDKVNRVFAPFKEETKCKIFNVSPKSNLNVFTKIDYTTMFNQMDNVVYNQNELRVWCITKLGGLK
jgi:hypothetical protein